jgi:hypothetical protein
MKNRGDMTMTASTAETVTLCEPKPARKSESEKMETTTMMASAATAPNAWAKSARASRIPRASACLNDRRSTTTAGTARQKTANQARATK